MIRARSPKLEHHSSRRRGSNARISCAVPRANSALAAGTVRTAAGRINSSVARSISQYTATAAAPAKTVAITNIAKFTRIHMSPPVAALHCAVQCVSHGARQDKSAENAGLRRRISAIVCVAQNTPWRPGRAAQCVRLARAGIRGSVGSLELSWLEHWLGAGLLIG